MTNEEVTKLLRDAQAFWKKYRDDPPDYNDTEAINRMVDEANIPVIGLPDRTTHLMLFFIDEIYERSKRKAGIE